MKLQGLTAIVTGATSGLGRAIALLFAQEGAAVVVCGRNEERGMAVVREIGKNGRAAFIQADVTDESSVQCMVEHVLSEFNQIDILVNNAGLMIPGSVPEITPEQWEKTWQTNVTSAYLVSHAVLPHMLARKSGVIVNMSSEAGLKGLKNRAAYCAAKTALIGLTKAMAVDHAGDGIRVNCLCPGTIETEMVHSLIESSPNPQQTRQMMLDRRLTPYLGTAAEIARAALFLSVPENAYTIGAILSVDGGAVVK